MPVLGLALAFAALATSASSTAPVATTTQSVTMPASQSVEDYVRDYFKDAPIMAEIAHCESRFKQLNADGSVVKNPHSSAVGAFQVMASIHASTAKNALGLNIYTLKGNAAYARYLYENEGTAPWNDSKACWGKSAQALARASNK